MKNEILREIILEQKAVQLPKHYLSRQVYQKILGLQNNPQIIVIKGLRRCGKATLLHEFRKAQKEADYYINFDDDRLVRFKLDDFQLLLELFIELYGVQKTFYFDEIQNIEGWERFVRRLHDQGNKIYITGSNATMFSEELGTRLTGRYIAVEMYPFSFKEYVNFEHPDLIKTQALVTTQKGQLRRVFSQYVKIGGIPEYFIYQVLEYLHTLYESVLFRDIVARYKINERALRELVYFLASNIGKEISFAKLSKLLGLASGSTVSDYCKYLENSYLCFFIYQFDYSLKKQLLNVKKVYFIDHALAKTIGFRMSDDGGRILENIVFIELKRRGKEIYFHKATKECDFLIKEATKIVEAFQVCLDFNSEETKEREFAGLLEAMEMYNLKEGYIITNNLSDTESVKHNGKQYKIIIVPIWQWLII